MLYVRFATPIAFTWYVLIGTSMTFATGIAVSYLLNEKPLNEKPSHANS